MDFHWLLRRKTRGIVKGFKPGLLIGIMVALALVVVARAYSDAKIGSGARAVVNENSVDSMVGIDAFGPVVPLQLMSMSASSFAMETGSAMDGEGQGSTANMLVPQLGPTTCGLITNNTANALWDISITAFGEAKMEVARSSLAAGESTDIICDLTGMDTGDHVWEGVATANWSSGRARIPFSMEFYVPPVEIQPLQQEAHEIEDPDSDPTDPGESVDPGDGVNVSESPSDQAFDDVDDGEDSEEGEGNSNIQGEELQNSTDVMISDDAVEAD